MKVIAAAASVLIMASAYANENYVCDFGSKVRYAKINAADPSVEIVKAEEKYTFIIDGKGKGSYIPVSSKIAAPGPVYVMKNGATTIFVEKNSGDNHFLVTVFNRSSGGLEKPAIITLHSWGVNRPKESYSPYVAIGSCLVYEN